MANVEYETFAKLELRVGTVLEAARNPAARRPAYVLRIDFGPVIGIKTSSAQITEAYSTDDLVGRQIIAVMNFAPKRVAGVKSEVLVLAAVSVDGPTFVLSPTHAVANGAPVS